MTNESEHNLTELVSSHLVAARYEALSSENITRAKRRLLDAIGNIAAGRRASGSAEVINLVQGWGGIAESSVLTTSTRVPAQFAAFTNAMLMRSYDFEATGADSLGGSQIPSHITGSTVAVALAVSEAYGRSGAELLTALVFGDDLASRLGHATGFDVYGGGDNTGTINVFGGIATAGILMGLSERQMRDAFGLGMNQLGGTIAGVFDQVLAFKLPIALSARNAVFSAQLAATGFSGPIDAFGGPFGYLKRYGSNTQPAVLRDRLGQDFFADASIKPWPSCRASHPTVDGVLRVMLGENITAHDVDRVVLHVTPRTQSGFLGQPLVVGDAPEVSGAFSLRFTAAIAVLDRSLELRHMNETQMTDPRVVEMMSRIELRDSLPAAEVLTAEVEIFTRDGKRLHSRVDYPLGDVNFHPLPDTEIEAKFRSNCAWGGLPDGTTTELLDFVSRIEECAAITELPQLMAKR